MREKHLVRLLGEGAVLGIRFSGQNSMICGGPKKFREVILKILGVFEKGNRKLSRRARRMPGSERSNKEIWKLLAVTRETKELGLQKLKKMGFKLEKVRNFRRLMG